MAWHGWPSGGKGKDYKDLLPDHVDTVYYPPRLHEFELDHVAFYPRTCRLEEVRTAWDL